MAFFNMETPQQDGKNFVHDVSQKDACKTCNGFSPHCQHTAFLHGVCLHEFRLGGMDWKIFQPEARHGLRSGRRMEKHGLTTNLITDENRAAGLPLWIISLDLSKTLDKVSWETVWEALRRQTETRGGTQMAWLHDQRCRIKEHASGSPTSFSSCIMLAKFRSAKLPSDFRPIPSVRILYKVFTYMVLARVELVLEANQPEEQHGFRGGRRLEEHLVSANLVIDKLLAVGKPVWIVSLDLSKAFDRVNWSKLWAALTAHGVSQHLVWIIQCLYWKQEGCVKGDTDVSNCFPINSGVRQGCVLSPKVFSSVQQWAMRKWRLDVENAHYGIDLQDDLPKLLDLRFADDILLFARTAHEALFLLESLMQEFEDVGLLLNGDKTVVLTNEAQPPSHLWTRTGIKLQVKNGSGGHKWLGCILGVGKAGRTTLDINHPLQAASKAFFANKTILCDRTVPVKARLRYFDAVVSPVAVFGSGHRTIHQKDLHHLDVACRKFLRAVVGPPSNLDLSRPWHEILHEWNGKVQSVALEHGMKLWNHRSLTHCWKLAMHFASIPHDRWIQRILKWTPGGRYAAGCPRHNWVTKISRYCVTKACPFYIGSDTSKKLYPQLLVLVHHTVPFTKMILQNWT